MICKIIRHLYQSLLMVLALLAVTGVPDAQAQESVSDNDVRVITKSLGYVRGLNNDGNGFRIAIIYDPSNPASLQEARLVQSLMSNGLNLEAGALVPEMVQVSALDQASNNQIIYVTRGLSNYYGRLREFSGRNKAFTISLDRSCADSGSCVVAVQTGERVRVFLNTEAMENSGFDVDAAFRYMAVRV